MLDKKKDLQVKRFKAWKPVGGYAMLAQAPNGRYYWINENVGNVLSFLRQKKLINFESQDRKIQKKMKAHMKYPIINTTEIFDFIFKTNITIDYHDKKWEIKQCQTKPYHP